MRQQATVMRWMPTNPSVAGAAFNLNAELDGFADPPHHLVKGACLSVTSVQLRDRSHVEAVAVALDYHVELLWLWHASCILILRLTRYAATGPSPAVRAVRICSRR